MPSGIAIYRMHILLTQKYRNVLLIQSSTRLDILVKSLVYGSIVFQFVRIMSIFNGIMLVCL